MSENYIALVKAYESIVNDTKNLGYTRLEEMKVYGEEKKNEK